MKILLIEDDIHIQKISKLVLEKTGHVVAQAVTGADGLAMARSVLPDVILLDYNLPDRDGPAILEAILADETIRSIPVIFLTAIARSDEGARFIELGARGLIGKPFKPTVLAGEIERILSIR